MPVAEIHSIAVTMICLNPAPRVFRTLFVRTSIFKLGGRLKGTPPPALTKGQNFGSCSKLHRKLTTYLEQRMVFNLTPTYTFVDLHIGRYRQTVRASRQCGSDLAAQTTA
jgi:hypothetical protein